MGVEIGLKVFVRAVEINVRGVCQGGWVFVREFDMNVRG